MIEIPDEGKIILFFLRNYAGSWFHSSRISRNLSSIGVVVSSQEVSKILLKLYRKGSGEIERLIRGNGQNQRAYYRAKKMMGGSSPE